MLLVIDPAQCQLLQEWVMTSQTLVSPANPQLSKNLLKRSLKNQAPDSDEVGWDLY